MFIIVMHIYHELKWENKNINIPNLKINLLHANISKFLLKKKLILVPPHKLASDAFNTRCVLEFKNCG